MQPGYHQDVRRQVALALIASIIVLACIPQPARLVIRTTEDPNACPGAGVPFPLRFQIDPRADEQVVAVARDGRRYLVWWAPGFEAGDVSDPVVRDPDGVVVAQDGEFLEGPLLHGHTVCATSDSIYILLV